MWWWPKLKSNMWFESYKMRTKFQNHINFPIIMVSTSIDSHQWSHCLVTFLKALNGAFLSQTFLCILINVFLENFHLPCLWFLSSVLLDINFLKILSFPSLHSSHYPSWFSTFPYIIIIQCFFFFKSIII